MNLLKKDSKLYIYSHEIRDKRCVHFRTTSSSMFRLDDSCNTKNITQLKSSSVCIDHRYIDYTLIRFVLLAVVLQLYHDTSRMLLQRCATSRVHQLTDFFSELFMIHSLSFTLLSSTCTIEYHVFRIEAGELIYWCTCRTVICDEAVVNQNEIE